MRIIPLVLMAVLLTACGGQEKPLAGAATDTEKPASEANGTDGAAAAYKEKVREKMSNSVVNSLVREWGVPEADVRCVLAQLKLSQIEQVQSDPAVRAVFEECGVDPAVAD